MSLASGFRLGPYEITAAVGSGGMGEVYRATDTRLGRDVAIKVLPDELAADEDRMGRFEQEARTLATLTHPNIVHIYDIGEQDARHYIAMEYVEGRTLQELLDDGALSPARTLEIATQIANGLAKAHASGVIHRDLKPANVILSVDGFVKILDFGLAKHAVVGGMSGGSDLDTIEKRGTTPGAIVGTPGFMSPEQVKGQPVTPQTDHFSFGAMVYEMVTGAGAFRRDTAVESLAAILNDEPPRATTVTPGLSDELSVVIERCLRKDPRDRFSSTSDLVDALKGVATSKTSSPRAHRAVARDEARDFLHSSFQTAMAGSGQLACVTGEAGIGKSTLVQSFLDQLAETSPGVALGRGRCSERLAGTDAYLPLLGALDVLLQGPLGSKLAESMRSEAPTWYEELGRTDPVERAPSQERLKREIASFVKHVARAHGLVLFFDDVHWADVSTVDLISYLASQFESTRILVIATYRPDELKLSDHPFANVKLDLQSRGLSKEFALPFLTAEDIAAYLSLEFPEHGFPRALAELLHAKTEGSPLFVVDLVRYLRDRDVVVRREGTWTLSKSVSDIETELPESVRGMIQKKIQRLEKPELQLLQVAAVQGYVFDTATVSTTLDSDPADVEDELQRLDDVHGLVKALSEEQLPDGTFAVKYRFVHVLYQNVLYESLNASRRASWSTKVARGLETFYRGREADIAAELAFLFEAARDFPKAADEYRVAAENANRVFAAQEAILLARRGLSLVASLPESPERHGLELSLQLVAGTSSLKVKGMASSDVADAFGRARELCQLLGETPRLFPVLRGLFVYYIARLELDASKELAELLTRIADEGDDDALKVEAHRAMAWDCFFVGDLVASRREFESSLELYDETRHHTLATTLGDDPRVMSLALGANAVWLLGYPDQALALSEEGIAYAHELAHPYSLALAMFLASLLRLFLRDIPELEKRASETIATSSELGFAHWAAEATILRGFAVAERGDIEAGREEIVAGLAAWQATGATVFPYHWLLLATAEGRCGQPERALETLEKSFEPAPCKRWWALFEPESFRVKGELMLDLGNATEAEACFDEAIASARRRSSKTFELRAIVSLHRLRAAQGGETPALPMLEDCYQWFTEGFDTPDLLEAKAILDGRA